MIEWILVVWLVLGTPEHPVLSPAFEVGTYRVQAACERSVATLKFEREDVSFVAACVERDKQ